METTDQAEVLHQNNVIAQDDDNDYQESGYVACVLGDRASIGHYSHCSCYGTWEEGNPDEVWTGTVAELIELAAHRRDPAMPERTISTEDYDYDHLEQVYKEVIAWRHRGAS